MLIVPGSVLGVDNFLVLTAVRSVILVGSDRFDANLLCHHTHDELGLRCAYQAPRERHAK